MEIIGLVPAAGFASRLGSIPCSKEVYPLLNSSGELTVISTHLLRYYNLAEIRNVFFIIRKGKWDIPDYFGDGSLFDLNIGYLIMNVSYGTPFTLNHAYHFAKDKIVALGFPDILFEPENAFAQLKEHFQKDSSDIVLGIAQSENYMRSDMVDFDQDGEINEIVIKQNRPDLKYGWFIAMWRPSFTLYLKEYLERFIKNNPEGKIILNDKSVREIYMGDVIQSALSNGLQVSYILFENGRFRDLGTLEELAEYSYICLKK
jgi:glucose-1-phosphate thymidylyltransferase